MSNTVVQDAHAVLFPAFDGLELSDAVREFLDHGGISILMGESRDEYVGRCMSDERRSREKATDFARLTEDARNRSGLLLAAVDQELGGICRLHDLVPQFPSKCDLEGSLPDDIEGLAKSVAEAASGMGVNLFLSPVVDVLDGENAWLDGRTWSAQPEIVATLSSAYICGVQAGGVAATAKHFPGFRSTTGDPAIDAFAECLTPLHEIEAGLSPFHAAISQGVEVVMVGPAIVRAIDPDKAALRSGKVVGMLKERMGFNGLVMADDLDAQATMRGDNLETVAIDALNAGCDFLLLADQGRHVPDLAKAIVAAAENGKICRDALALSASKVRSLAQSYRTQR